jgi:hypothetical protein
MFEPTTAAAPVATAAIAVLLIVIVSLYHKIQHLQRDFEEAIDLLKAQLSNERDEIEHLKAEVRRFQEAPDKKGKALDAAE